MSAERLTSWRRLADADETTPKVALAVIAAFAARGAVPSGATEETIPLCRGAVEAGRIWLPGPGQRSPHLEVNLNDENRDAVLAVLSALSPSSTLRGREHSSIDLHRLDGATDAIDKLVALVVPAAD
jgi:hypothetical protein